MRERLLSRHDNHITLVLVYISETTEVPAQQHHITITQHTKHDTPQQLIESDTEVIEEYTTKFRRGSKEDETAAVKTKKTIIRKKKPKTEAEEDNVVVIEEELEDIKPQIPSIPKKQFMPIEEITTTMDVEEIIPTRIDEVEETQKEEEKIEVEVIQVQDTDKTKKVTKKIIRQKGRTQKVTEETTVEEEGKAPVTTVITKPTEIIETTEREIKKEKPVEEQIPEEETKPLAPVEYITPMVQHVEEQVTVTEEVSKEGKPKKVTKKKVIKRDGKEQQVTEEVTVEEEGKAPETSVIEGPVEEIVEEIMKRLPAPAYAKPSEVEEVKEQVTVTEEVTRWGKPKKTTRKKIITRKGQKQQVTEVVTVEEQDKAPITTVIEGPTEEVVEETIKPLPAPEHITPTEVEEVREQVTVTEEITREGKPKKITKKKLIKRRGKEQQVTEVVTVEEQGKKPVTTVTEGPTEEIVEETIKPLPAPERITPTEVEEVREQVTVTEEITREGKPKKITKKKLIKRRGKEQQVTEVVTVEEQGKRPVTTVTEGPTEEVVKEIIKALPAPEEVRPTEVEQIREQVTVTEEITKEGKPKKITKKKTIKRKGKEQQVTEVVTVEEHGKKPVTTVTEGPVEEVVEEVIKPLALPEYITPTEVEEIREQVTVTEEVTKEGKPKKTTKKKIIKRKGKDQQVTEMVTVEEQGKRPVTTVTEGPTEEVVEDIIKALPAPEKERPTEVEEIREQVTVTEEVTKEGKPKKVTKKKITRRKGKEQQVTEVVTVEEQDKPPVTTVIDGPTEELIEEIIKPLPAPEKIRPSEVEEIREQVTVAEEVTMEGKPKKITKKKIVKRKGKEQQVTELVTVEEQGKAPVTTITEGPLEEVLEDTLEVLPAPEHSKPGEIEEIREQVTVTEEVTTEGKPKKITKKKVIKRKGKEQQVTEVVTVEVKGKRPVTTVTEGPVEEVVQEFVKPLSIIQRVEPSEVEEIREEVTVTQEVTNEGKPKKTTKKRIIKRKGREQQVTEFVTVEEQGKRPVKTVSEGPIEEVVEETLKALPSPEYAKPGEEEEIREQVTVTEEVTGEGKPKKVTKKKVVKRKGKEQQVTEVTTVEEQGKAPVTTVIEGPTEQLVEEIIKPLPTPEKIKPFEEEEIREQVTITEEITKEGKPRRVTKKKVIKRKGREQQISDIITVEEQGKAPITTITEGPTEEILEESIKALPAPEYAKPDEVEEVREQVTVTQEVTKEGKPKKTTKKKVIKRKGKVQQVTEVTTVEEQGKRPVTTVTEGPVEEVVEDMLKPLPTPEFVKPSEVEEVHEQVTITEEVTKEGKPKKVKKKKVITRKGREQQVSEVVTIEEQGEAPVTTVIEGPTEEIVEETIKTLSGPEYAKPGEEEEIREQVTVTQEVTEEGKPKKITKKKVIKRKGKKQQVTEVVTIEEQGKRPTTTVTEGAVEEIVEEMVKPLPAAKRVKPTEVEEVREQVTITEEITKEGKPTKVTKKKQIKRKGKQQQVTEVVTIEEQGKAPVTTVTEGPTEEVVEETLKALPAPKYAKPSEIEELREQVTVTQEITKEGKPKKTIKKRVVRRKGPQQQVTEVVTVEEEGKAPVTTVTEGPVEELIDDIIKPLPIPEHVKPTEVEEVREQVTVTEEVTKEGKPKKVTKKKIIRRKGREQQVSEVITVEEQGKLPVTTVTDGPTEEIVEEALKALPAPEHAKPGEVEEVREQVTVTQEVTKEGKPKKVTKKKVIKRKGKEQQVTEIVTIEEKGKRPVTTVTEGPIEEVVEEIVKALPITERIEPTEKAEAPEEVEVTEIVTKEGKSKKVIKKKVPKKVLISEEEKIEAPEAPEVPLEIAKKKPVKLQRMKITKFEATKLEVQEVSVDKPQFAQIKLRKTPTVKRPVEKKDKLPRVLLRSRITSIEWPPAIKHLKIEELEPNEIQNGILSRNIEEADKLPKPKRKRIKRIEKEIAKLEKLDQEFEELKKELPLEKLEEPVPEVKPEKKVKKKKPIEKVEGEKPQLMRISIKEQKAIKPKIEEPATPLFAQIKLKKAPVKPKKKEDKDEKFPKILLRSRITEHEWPPSVKYPIITELEPNYVQNGILSRTMEEALKLKKIRHKKVKLPEKEITELEKVDQEFEELKKVPLEKVEEMAPYERKSKPEKPEEEKPKKLKIGKGKPRSAEEEKPETVKLKKIPEKVPSVLEEEAPVPKKKEEKEKPKKEKEEKEYPELKPFEPYEIEAPEVELEEREVPEYPEPGKKIPKKVPSKKPKKERKTPTQETDVIPIVPGIPKPEEPEEEEEIKRRIPEREAPKEEPEKIKLKPWKKPEEKEEEEKKPEDYLKFVPKDDDIVETVEVVTTVITEEIPKKKPRKIKKKKTTTKRGDEKPIVVEETTIEEEGEEPVVTVEEIVKDKPMVLPIESIVPAAPVEEVKEEIVTSEIVTEEGTKKTVRKRRVTRKYEGKEQVTEEVTVEEEGKEPLTATIEIHEDTTPEIHEKPKHKRPTKPKADKNVTEGKLISYVLLSSHTTIYIYTFTLNHVIIHLSNSA